MSSYYIMPFDFMGCGFKYLTHKSQNDETGKWANANREEMAKRKRTKRKKRMVYVEWTVKDEKKRQI